MSYILDALRKSDQQRQHGMAPTLATAPLPAPTSNTRGKPARLFISLLALLLIGIGLSIGWLRPWQGEPAAPTPSPSRATPPPEAATPQAMPIPAARTVSKPESDVPLPMATAPTVQPAAAPAPIPMVKVEPPVSGRQDLPRVTITVHAYSPDPAERLAAINGRMLHEGDEVEPGLKLERITADGVVLNYKGRRFRREVH